MNEAFLLGLLVAGVIATATAMRAMSQERHTRALSRLESKVDALLKHQGVHFDPYSDVPATVIDALRRGEKIEAIKQYRSATGVGLKEAKERVEDLQRRAG
jgi:ribosomal protein L7/L12